MYQQIIDQLKYAILNRELEEGDALPSIRALADELKISVITIQRAYKELERQGLVATLAARGTFVLSTKHETFTIYKQQILENQLRNLIQTAKSLDVSKEQLNAMVDNLYKNFSQ